MTAVQNASASTLASYELELAAREAELNRREAAVRRREESRAEADERTAELNRRERDLESMLEAEIRITVLHEVAHYFGIDEDRLDDLGFS